MGINWLRSLLPHRHSRSSSSHGTANLTELAVPPPVENSDDQPIYVHHTLEGNISHSPDGSKHHTSESSGHLANKSQTLEAAHQDAKGNEGL